MDDKNILHTSLRQIDKHGLNRDKIAINVTLLLLMYHSLATSEKMTSGNTPSKNWKIKAM